MSCKNIRSKNIMVFKIWNNKTYVSQEPYVNRSAPHIEEDFALHRTYIVFHTLGLRHLTVVDIGNRVVGIISRKDLMGFNLEEKLEQRKRRGFSLEGGIQKLLPSEQTCSDSGQVWTWWCHV